MAVVTQTESIVVELADYAPNYQNEVFDAIADELDVTRRGLLEADSRKGLAFFLRLYGFSRSGARKAGYQHRAVEALQKTPDGDLMEPDAVWRRFATECERNGTGTYERRNRGLVTETCRFANRKGNLFRWVPREIENGVRLQSLVEELESIHGIGPGKSRFFFRDAVWLSDSEVEIERKDRYLLQPITGPIETVGETLWPGCETEDELAKRIARACENAGVSGVEFNQGAWYFQDRVSEDLDSLVREVE